ncbi:hypothetical protein ACLKA7_007643 [Drosophila subpalustris]
MDEEDKMCILYFDEMKVAANYEYDHSLEAVQEPREYVQVAMAQGLRMSWKQLIYFDFDTPVIILYKLIEKLHMVGYHVVGIVNDLGPGNHKLWTKLGVSPARNTKILDTMANVEVEPVPWLDIDIASMQSSSSSSVPANLAIADEAGENVAELESELTDDSIEYISGYLIIN